MVIDREVEEEEHDHSLEADKPEEEEAEASGTVIEEPEAQVQEDHIDREVSNEKVTKNDMIDI